MKYAVGLLIFLCVTQGLAYPGVGDKVQWTGTIRLLDGSNTPVHISKEVSAFNARTHMWTIKLETTLGEKKSSKVMEVAELYTPEKFKTLIAGCLSQGGVLEKITAPAGTYETCKITETTPEGLVVEKWWGDIPFGVVSKSTKDFTTKVDLKDLDSLLAGL
ncbi:hypothetical protein [Bdellovibrio sp.]|uniref:hypothetical protein n=1 Tax=Bdellovibrio sp. TaxID=28201 RepID=UPI0039E218FB